ncbi:hypothetical protein DAPPUDRAFT_313677 [Daphnia pulex]|uniref:Ionotropic glutamate receptor C-terminal domain-containing protein n=1 Tax=Daphnia pulex TaxID=6669 RepID=E9G3T9_DAPPU|nr:hypothetical protein DAPPUDRAFT_313677 [Daphnia pulex]|eukprot:EFX85831.1 hypothetical protein DAPPUDRAFT_313677 [Daphnia pulex]
MVRCISSDSTYLSGKHLIVGVQEIETHLYVKRNSSGHIIKVDGVAAWTLAALSLRLNFTYSFLQVNDTRLEKQSDALPGLAYYMAKGKCDLVIGALLMTSRRFATMDLAEGYAYTDAALLIPMPELSDNYCAILQPFNLTVWIGLLIMTPITSVVVYFSFRPVTCKASLNGKYCGKISQFLFGARQAFFQLIQILLFQGVYFPRMRNAVYFVVGSWCLGALVLGCAYNSLLISYILGSNSEPLVDSLADLVKNPNVQLVVEKGRGIELAILGDDKPGLYKQLGDKMRSQTKSNCVTLQECVELVKSGSYAHFNLKSTAIHAIDVDYKATGKCNLAMAKNMEVIPGTLAWALPKRSPYTRIFAKGFMELHEDGLIEFLIRRDQERHNNVTKCLDEARRRQQKKAVSGNTRLISLGNFSGAFYVLIIGYFISFVCFIRENIYYRMSKCFHKLSYKRKFISRKQSKGSQGKVVKVDNNNLHSAIEETDEVFPYLQ